VRCGGGDRPQQRAVATSHEWQRERADQLLAGRAPWNCHYRRSRSRWCRMESMTPGRVAASNSLNSLLTLGWTNQTRGRCGKVDGASSQRRLGWPKCRGLIVIFGLVRRAWPLLHKVTRQQRPLVRPSFTRCCLWSSDDGVLHWPSSQCYLSPQACRSVTVSCCPQGVYRMTGTGPQIGSTRRIHCCC
jgi:hypothetical protein